MEVDRVDGFRGGFSSGPPLCGARTRQLAGGVTPERIRGRATDMLPTGKPAGPPVGRSTYGFFLS